MLSFVAFIAEDNDSYLAFEKAEVVSANALRDMNYSGGFAPPSHSKMINRGPTRLALVTIPALKEQGAHKFAWITKNEFGLNAPHGAFMYCSGQRDARVYLKLQPFRSAHQQHEDEENGSFHSAHREHREGGEAPQTYDPSAEERE